VEESIDAMGSGKSVEGLQSSFRSAVATCHRLTVKVPGQGSMTVKVAEVSAPAFGEHTFAARMTANGGPLDGLEITQVLAGVGDVVVSVSFVGASPDVVDGATEDAVNKAKKVLGAGPSHV